MKLSIAIAAVALSGCAAMQTPNMSADELRAIVADKSAAVVCVMVQTPAGTGKLVIVNADRLPKDAGTITADANCVVTMSGAGSVAPIK